MICTSIYHDSDGPYCKIPLTRGKFAKVDPEDYPYLSQFRWYAKPGKTTTYAVREIRRGGEHKRIRMHRLIMNTPATLVCDHINHDGCDNRKANLRNCSIQQNNANKRSARNSSSKYKGVSWNKYRGKFAANIATEGKRICLGTFDSETEAARVYDTAAKKYHGQFANLNFPTPPA